MVTQEDFEALARRVEALEQLPRRVVPEEIKVKMRQYLQLYIQKAEPSSTFEIDKDVYLFRGGYIYIQPARLIAEIKASLWFTYSPTSIKGAIGAKNKSLRAGKQTRNMWAWPEEQFKDLLKPMPERPDPKSIEHVLGWVTIPEFCRRGEIPEYAVRNMVEKGELTVGYYIDGQMTTIEFDEGSRKYLKLEELPKAAALKAERTPGRPAIEAEGPDIPEWHKEGDPDGKTS
jgi:hypothetical protein